MFRNFFRINQSYWLLVPMVLQATIPWFSYRIRITYVFIFVVLWLLCNFNLIIQSLCGPQGRLARIFITWYLLFNLTGYVYACFGHGEFLGIDKVKTVVAQTFFFLVVHTTLVKGKFAEIRFLTLTVIIGMCCAGIMGSRGLSVEGLEGARSLVGSLEAVGSRLDQQMLTFSLGLGDYRYVYMCAWTCPLFLMSAYLVKRKFVKLLLISPAVANVVCVRTSGLGTVTAILAISLCIYIAWRAFRSSRTFLRVSGIALVLMFFIFAASPRTLTIFSAPIRAMAENMSEGSVKARFMLVADSLSGSSWSDNYAEERVRLQLVSLSGFIKRPIFGWGQYNDWTKELETCGGHSLILDHMSYYGVIGLIPLIGMLVYFQKYNEWLAKTYFGEKWRSLPIMFMSLFVFTSIANPTFGIPHMMFILLPGLGYIIAVSNGRLPVCNFIHPSYNCYPPNNPYHSNSI